MKKRIWLGCLTTLIPLSLVISCGDENPENTAPTIKLKADAKIAGVAFDGKNITVPYGTVINNEVVRNLFDVDDPDNDTISLKVDFGGYDSHKPANYTITVTPNDGKVDGTNFAINVKVNLEYWDGEAQFSSWYRDSYTSDFSPGGVKAAVKNLKIGDEVVDAAISLFVHEMITPESSYLPSDIRMPDMHSKFTIKSLYNDATSSVGLHLSITRENYLGSFEKDITVCDRPVPAEPDPIFFEKIIDKKSTKTKAQLEKVIKDKSYDVMMGKDKYTEADLGIEFNLPEGSKILIDLVTLDLDDSSKWDYKVSVFVISANIHQIITLTPADAPFEMQKYLKDQNSLKKFQELDKLALNQPVTEEQLGISFKVPKWVLEETKWKEKEIVITEKNAVDEKLTLQITSGSDTYEVKVTAAPSEPTIQDLINAYQELYEVPGTNLAYDAVKWKVNDKIDEPRFAFGMWNNHPFRAPEGYSLEIMVTKAYDQVTNSIQIELTLTNNDTKEQASKTITITDHDGLNP